MKKEILEKLEKQLIIDGDAEAESIENLIERISEFTLVDKGGHVVIKDILKNKINVSDKILLSLSTRFLASKLQEKLERDITISPNITAKELSEFLKIKRDTITARLNDLKNERKIILRERGSFSIASYYIETLLEKIEKARNHNTH